MNRQAFYRGFVKRAGDFRLVLDDKTTPEQLDAQMKQLAASMKPVVSGTAHAIASGTNHLLSGTSHLLGRH